MRLPFPAESSQIRIYIEYKVDNQTYTINNNGYFYTVSEPAPTEMPTPAPTPEQYSDLVRAVTLGDSRYYVWLILKELNVPKTVTINSSINNGHFGTLCAAQFYSPRDIYTETWRGDCPLAWTTNHLKFYVEYIVNNVTRIDNNFRYYEYGLPTQQPPASPITEQPTPEPTTIPIPTPTTVNPTLEPTPVPTPPNPTPVTTTSTPIPAPTTPEPTTPQPTTTTPTTLEPITTTPTPATPGSTTPAPATPTPTPTTIPVPSTPKPTTPAPTTPAPALPPSSFFNRLCRPFPHWFCFSLCKWNDQQDRCIGKSFHVITMIDEGLSSVPR